jgi:hypothetical protein
MAEAVAVVVGVGEAALGAGDCTVGVGPMIGAGWVGRARRA